MAEVEQRFWDTIIKAVTAAVALGVAMVGLWQYQEVSRNNIANQKIERYKLRMERYNLLVTDSKEQVKTLRETSEIASTLATAQDKKVLAQARERFWQLYWGDLIGVENVELEEKMVQMGSALQAPDGPKFSEEPRGVNIACLNQIKEIKKSVRPPALEDF